MKYNKIFGVSALAMGVALGFTSCSNEDEVLLEEQQPVAVETVQSTYVQKTTFQTAVSDFLAKNGKTNSPVLKKVNALPNLPEGFGGDVVSQLTDILKQVIGVIKGESDAIEAYIALSGIHGEFTFDSESQKWTIDNINADELILHYDLQGKAYTTTISFGEDQKIYCSKLAKEVTVFNKTFILKAAIGVPTNMNITQTEDGQKVIDGTIGVSVKDPSDFDLTKDAWTMTTDLYVNAGEINGINVEGTVKSTTEFEGTVQSINASIVQNEAELASVAFTAEGNGGTFVAHIAGFEISEGNVIDATLEAQVNDVKELIDNVILLYKPECSEEGAIRCVDAINANLNGGIKVYALGSETPVATVTFSYTTTEQGGYTLKPEIEYNTDAVIDAVVDAVAEQIATELGVDTEVVNTVVDALTNLGNGEELSDEDKAELVEALGEIAEALAENKGIDLDEGTIDTIVNAISDGELTEEEMEAFIEAAADLAEGLGEALGLDLDEDTIDAVVDIVKDGDLTPEEIMQLVSILMGIVGGGAE